MTRRRSLAAALEADLRSLEGVVDDQAALVALARRMVRSVEDARSERDRVSSSRELRMVLRDLRANLPKPVDDEDEQWFAELGRAEVVP